MLARVLAIEAEAVTEFYRDRRTILAIEAEAAAVWEKAEATPGFNKAMEEGVADIAAGRVHPLHEAATLDDWSGTKVPMHVARMRDAILAIEAEAATLDVERLVEGWRTTYDTIIHKGLMAYAVEKAWDASVSAVGDPEDGIEQHDLAVLADGIVDALLAAYSEARDE